MSDEVVSYLRIRLLPLSPYDQFATPSRPPRLRVVLERTSSKQAHLGDHGKAHATLILEGGAV
jgi:hypothetical protein